MKTLLEQCKTCEFNWDGHCINGNDNWKFKTGETAIVECEDYKAKEDDVNGK